MMMCQFSHPTRLQLSHIASSGTIPHMPNLPPAMTASRRRTLALTGAFAGALALPVASVTAQLSAAPLVPLGRTIDGTLTRDGQTLNERGSFQVFRLDVKPGQRYSIVMRADDFDAFLSVARLVNGLTDYLASNDDGAGNSNARLRWSSREAGPYYLIAQSLKPDGVGMFTVRLDTMPAVIITSPRPVTIGTAITGELTETDPSLDDGKGAYYDLYRVTLRKGQRVSIAMTAPSELDSYVAIGRMNGDTLAVEESDDDGGGDKNARLRFTPKEDGTYIVRAQALDVNSTGTYTLMVSERAARTAAIVDLASNVMTTGELTDADDEADDGSLFDGYRVTGRAGEKISVTMRSSSFDSYLAIGRMVNGEWKQLAYDDDGAGGNNARLEHTFDEGGDYIIRANTVGAGKTGAYTIRLERIGAIPSAAPRRRP